MSDVEAWADGSGPAAAGGDAPASPPQAESPAAPRVRWSIAGASPSSSPSTSAAASPAVTRRRESLSRLGQSMKRGWDQTRELVSLPKHVEKGTALALSIKPRSELQPKEAVLACPSCTKKFGALRSRHHCRTCGEVLCAKCSRYRLKLRLCHPCHEQAREEGEESDDDEEVEAERLERERLRQAAQEAEKRGLKAELELTTDEASKLREQLGTASEWLDQSRQENAALREENAALRDELEATQAAVAALQSSLRAAAEAKTQTEQLVEKESKRRQAEAQLFKRKFAKRASEARKREDEHKTQQAALQQTLAARSSEASEARAEIARLQQMHEDMLATRNLEATEQERALTERLNRARRDNAELEARLGALEADLQHAQAQHAHRLDSVGTTLAEREEELADVRDELAAIVAERDSLAATVAELRGAIDDAEARRKKPADALDKDINALLNALNPSRMFNLIRIGPGLYQTQDGKKMAIRAVIMVRVGGGWEELSAYLTSSYARFFNHSKLDPKATHAIKRAEQVWEEKANHHSAHTQRRTPGRPSIGERSAASSSAASLDSAASPVRAGTGNSFNSSGIGLGDDSIDGGGAGGGSDDDGGGAGGSDDARAAAPQWSPDSESF